MIELVIEIDKLNFLFVIVIRDLKFWRFELGSVKILGKLKGFIELDLVK